MPESKSRKIAGAFNNVGNDAILKTGRSTDIVKSTATIPDQAETVIDTIDGNTVRASKYTITAQTLGDSDHQAQEILLTHNGTTATLTSYGTLLHGDNTIVTYDTTIDSSTGTISLLAAPDAAVFGLKFSIERSDVKTV